MFQKARFSLCKYLIVCTHECICVRHCDVRAEDKSADIASSPSRSLPQPFSQSLTLTSFHFLHFLHPLFFPPSPSSSQLITYPFRSLHFPHRCCTFLSSSAFLVDNGEILTTCDLSTPACCQRANKAIQIPSHSR